MKDPGGTPPSETMICGRCATACAIDDNFCHECGMPLREQLLPSVREHRLPVAWRPPVPAVVVKGAAFIVAGTLAEMFARRMVRRAFGGQRRQERTLTPEAKEAAVVANGTTEEAQLVSETFLMRRVRIRR